MAKSNVTLCSYRPALSDSCVNNNGGGMKGQDFSSASLPPPSAFRPPTQQQQQQQPHQNQMQLMTTTNQSLSRAAVEVRRVKLAYGRGKNAKTILSEINLNVPEGAM